MLDYSKATPPMPQSLDKFITRMCDENKHLMDEVSDKDFNQLTINEYLPGQGIASHTGFNSPETSSVLLIYHLE